ncbi:ATP-binding protein [Streptomyces sp. NPDC059076]|uniref:ATP-binding protein n=1 Tax=unclassified Streptomyces TaxID=2593676 RepID=UPI0036A12785
MSLTVEPSKIGVVRRAVVDRLKDVGHREAAPDVGLVVTELLANVHKHAEGICHLEIEPRGERLVLRLSDTVHNLPTVRQLSDCAETGRGLLLVAALTEHWESTTTPTGKVVTCTFHTAAVSSQTKADR